jgi:hypothetical protein
MPAGFAPGDMVAQISGSYKDFLKPVAILPITADLLCRI